MNENELSRHIVTAAIEVHRTLGGPGERYVKHGIHRVVNELS
jgi:hypothetical protein